MVSDLSKGECYRSFEQVGSGYDKEILWMRSAHVALSFILIEKDHLGDWSPEKDCCL